MNWYKILGRVLYVVACLILIGGGVMRFQGAGPANWLSLVGTVSLLPSAYLYLLVLRNEYRESSESRNNMFR